MIRLNVKIQGLDDPLKVMANPLPGLHLAGWAVRQLLVDWFRTKNEAEPNRLGGRRTDFWMAVGRSVAKPQSQGNRAVQVDILHPAFAQKLHGGLLTPKLKQWLAIPAQALAYGKPPGSFMLRFVPINPELACLVRREDMAEPIRFPSQRRTATGVEAFTQDLKLTAGAVMYWLKKQVRQAPWPGSLPSDGLLADTAQNSFEEWLRRALEHRPAPGGPI